MAQSITTPLSEEKMLNKKKEITILLLVTFLIHYLWNDLYIFHFFQKKSLINIRNSLKMDLSNSFGNLVVFGWDDSLLTMLNFFVV